jgi:predicted nucleotidyltransferase
VSNLRAIATSVAAEAIERRDAIAVLLTGSVARGDAVASSDVDLIFVTAPGVDLAGMRRELRDDVLVETVARSEAEWRERFRRPTPRWVYAFVEAEVLFDSGVAARLISDANDVKTGYLTPMSVLDDLAVGLWHGQGKLDRALASNDPVVRGYHAAVAVDWIIDALFAVHDIPLPAVSRRLDYLADVPLDPGVARDWSILLTGGVNERLETVATLIGWLRERLPEPELDRS